VEAVAAGAGAGAGVVLLLEIRKTSLATLVRRMMRCPPTLSRLSCSGAVSSLAPLHCVQDKNGTGCSPIR
jgi:hypothetical protein